MRYVCASVGVGERAIVAAVGPCRAAEAAAAAASAGVAWLALAVVFR